MPVAVRHKLLKTKRYGHTHDAEDIDEPVYMPLDRKRSPIEEPGEHFRLSSAAVALLNRLARLGIRLQDSYHPNEGDKKAHHKLFSELYVACA